MTKTKSVIYNLFTRTEQNALYFLCSKRQMGGEI